MEPVRRGGSSGLADLGGALLAGVAAALGGVVPETRPIVLPGQRVREKLAAGIPLLHGEEVYVDAGAVRAAWERLLAAIETSDDWRADVAGVRAVLTDHRLHAEHATVEALVSHPEHVSQLAAAADAPVGLVQRLADLAARPVLAAYARQLAPALGLAAWERGYCPICGAWPVRGERSADRAGLHLRCARCATGWAPSRPTCPFCGRIDRPAEPVAPDDGQHGAGLLECRGCAHGLPVVESPERPPTVASLLGKDDITRARNASGGAPGLARASGAGFRLELAESETAWEGFDDD